MCPTLHELKTSLHNGCPLLAYNGKTGHEWCRKYGVKVDKEKSNKYCHGVHYLGCPTYRDAERFPYKELCENEATGCFLTSACVEARGLADDCHELRVLRSYRDGYLRSLPEGPKEVEEYYEVAPQIVEAIQQLGDASKIFDRIYETLVLPCVQSIEQGDMESAHVLYRNTVRELKAQYLK